MFDPSGAFCFEGKYHVFSYHHIASFLQFTSHDHYASDDLVHWDTWPLGPVADGEVDSWGIWLANHVVDDQGVPTVIYGGFGREGDGDSHGVRALSRDGLVSYEDKTVVFPEYHDGHAWKEGDTWYAITMRHSAVKEYKDPEILVFTSPDLDHWTERGVLFKFPNDFTFVEFPYLISFGPKDILMVGDSHGCLYWIGRFDRETFRFIPDEPDGLLLDYSNPFTVFNPSIVDAKGPGGSPRRVLMALESRPHGTVGGLPWRGVLAIPRVLTLDDARLHQEPVPEIETLRGEHQSFEGIKVTAGAPVRIAAKGDALEIAAVFENRGANKFGLLVRVSDDRATSVRVFYDAETDELGVDGNIQPVGWVPDAETGVDGDPQPGAPPSLKPVRHGRGPAYSEPSEPIRIRVFLDKALLEVFVNGQTCTTSLEDTNPSHNGIELFSAGGDSMCTRIDIWEMGRSL
jgi:beta-fructofuranosidase